MCSKGLKIGSMKFIYFDFDYAVKEHDYIIEHSWGLAGAKDLGQLHAALDFVRDDNYYPNLEDKVSYLFY